MNPFASLLKSRKFWLMILDTVVSMVTFIVSSYFPEHLEMAKFFIGSIQPVFIMVIGSVAYEDVANAQAKSRLAVANVEFDAQRYSSDAYAAADAARLAAEK